MKFEAWPWKVAQKDGFSLEIESKSQIKFEIEIPDEVVKAYAEKVLGLMTYQTAMARQALEPPDDIDFSDEDFRDDEPD